MLSNRARIFLRKLKAQEGMQVPYLNPDDRFKDYYSMLNTPIDESAIQPNFQAAQERATKGIFNFDPGQVQMSEDFGLGSYLDAQGNVQQRKGSYEISEKIGKMNIPFLSNWTKSVVGMYDFFESFKDKKKQEAYERNSQADLKKRKEEARANSFYMTPYTSGRTDKLTRKLGGKVYQQGGDIMDSFMDYYNQQQQSSLDSIQQLQQGYDERNRQLEQEWKNRKTQGFAQWQGAGAASFGEYMKTFGGGMGGGMKAQQGGYVPLDSVNYKHQYSSFVDYYNPPYTMDAAQQIVNPPKHITDKVSINSISSVTQRQKEADKHSKSPRFYSDKLQFLGRKMNPKILDDNIFTSEYYPEYKYSDTSKFKKLVDLDNDYTIVKNAKDEMYIRHPKSGNYRKLTQSEYEDLTTGHNSTEKPYIYSNSKFYVKGGPIEESDKYQEGGYVGPVKTNPLDPGYINKNVPANPQQIQKLGNIKFDTNTARRGKYDEDLIVKDIKTKKDYKVVRNQDGSYRFWNEEKDRPIYSAIKEARKQVADNFIEIGNSYKHVPTRMDSLRTTPEGDNKYRWVMDGKITPEHQNKLDSLIKSKEELVKERYSKKAQKVNSIRPIISDKLGPEGESGYVKGKKEMFVYAPDSLSTVNTARHEFEHVGQDIYDTFDIYDDIKELAKNASNNYSFRGYSQADFNYLSDPDEIGARFLNLKQLMKEKGFSDISEVADYLSKNRKHKSDASFSTKMRGYDNSDPHFDLHQLFDLYGHSDLLKKHYNYYNTPKGEFQEGGEIDTESLYSPNFVSPYEQDEQASQQLQDKIYTDNPGMSYENKDSLMKWLFEEEPLQTYTINDIYNQQYNQQQSQEEDLPKGDIATVHLNPGNIKYGNFAAKYGATPGRRATDGGVFAKFPTVEAGLQAQKDLLTSGSYANLTVANAMRRWSNNGYGADLYPQIANKKMKDLTPQELNELVLRQTKRESPTIYKKIYG